MNLSLADCPIFIHHCKRILPASAMPGVWRRWSSLSSWPEWDVSLSETITESDGLFLGRRFQVKPKVTGQAISTIVTSFSEYEHFATTSFGPLGLMTFGHTLTKAPKSERTLVTHSICAAPTDAKLFAERVWTGLKSDLEAAVDGLVKLIEGANR